MKIIIPLALIVFTAAPVFSEPSVEIPAAQAFQTFGDWQKSSRAVPKGLLLAQDQKTEEDLRSLEKDLELPEQQIVSDPLYGFNKAIFYVNDKLYFWVLKPTARAWKAVVPQVARESLKNFLYNLRFPQRFVSSLLQGKGEKAQAELDRFLLNSTVGIAGLLNPAKQHDSLNPAAEDLGQTFGVWGVGNGFYLVLPVLGPTTLRDGIGTVGDIFLDPIYWISREVNNIWVMGGFYTGEAINDVSFRIGDYEAIKAAALDPYIAVRDGYIQNRRAAVEK